MNRRVPQVKPRSRVWIEQRAEAVLQRLIPEKIPLTGPVDILRIFDRLDLIDPNLIPGVEDLNGDLLGQMSPSGEVFLSPQTYAGVLDGSPRARFTTAHECGHAVLHFSQLKSKLTDGGMRLYRRSELPAYRDPEWQANAFAAAILMPAVAVRRLVENVPGNRELAIARYFEVSQESAGIRLNTLKLNP